MNRMQQHLQMQTRRHFFRDCGVGIGKVALASLHCGERLLGKETQSFINPLAPRQPQFSARVKNVIYLFMAGGPASWNYSIINRSCKNSTASRFRSPT